MNKPLAILAALCLPLALHAESPEESYALYLQIFQQQALKDERLPANTVLALRFFEQHGRMTAGFTIFITKETTDLAGQIVVVSGSGGSPTINSRALNEHETRRIVDIVNRREMLSLPTQFSPAVDLKIPRSGEVLVELVAENPKRRNLIARALTETDSVQELRDWVVEIAHTKSDGWKIEGK